MKYFVQSELPKYAVFWAERNSHRYHSFSRYHVNEILFFFREIPDFRAQETHNFLRIEIYGDFVEAGVKIYSGIVKNAPVHEHTQAKQYPKRVD